MLKRKPTNWNKYINNNPANFFVRNFFLEAVFNAYKNLLSKVNFKTPISVLELGCGTGYTNFRISQTISTKKITLVDFNCNMLDIAKKNLNSVDCKKKFIHQDFFKLRLNEKFDLVHSQGVVEHFEGKKQDQLLNLHFQMVKKGGYCIIYVPTPTLSYRFLRKTAEVLKIWKYTDETPILKETLIKKIEKSGFKVIASNYFWKYYWLSEIGVLAYKK